MLSPAAKPVVHFLDKENDEGKLTELPTSDFRGSEGLHAVHEG